MTVQRAGYMWSISVGNADRNGDTNEERHSTRTHIDSCIYSDMTMTTKHRETSQEVALKLSEAEFDMKKRMFCIFSCIALP